MIPPTTKELVNGLDVEALREKAQAIQADPKLGMTRWNVTTRWMGGARSDSSVTSYEIGGQRVEKDFTIRVDEPLELCGTNQFANPQEVLLASLNACMTVGYVAAFVGKAPSPPAISGRGSDPFAIARIGEDYVERLPGPGRRTLLSVLHEKLRRA